LAGLLPTSGEVRWHGNDLKTLDRRARGLQLSWLGQGEATTLDLRVWDVAMLGRLPHQGWWGTPTAQDAQMCEAALKATQAWDWRERTLGELSGGERNRVHLAKLLKSGGNVLLLDEPTNDLDVDTLRALESALEAFPGCAVVISHDRWFLDRIATHVLAFEGNSQVRWFEGNFQDYEAWRRKELGVDAEQPRRLRYKPLTRK
jgi:ATPase subunit of ABC transporter with duplicated ATPase domains